MTPVVFAGRVHEDFDACYRACQARDPRFDGWIYVGVTSTGIYCRPSCPATTPKPTNMRFYPTAAAAQQAGFRACRRCRPDASPGSPEWDIRADVVARAMRGIADGVVDREGVEGLARRLGYSPRQLERLVRAELGTGPLAIARAQRAQTARVLIETTDLDFSAIAFAAGFSSIRQFNDTIRQIFALTPDRDARPSPPRRRRRRRLAAGRWPPPGDPGAPGPPPPLQRRRRAGPPRARRPCPASRSSTTTTMTYRRTLRLPHGSGVVALTPRDDHVEGAAAARRSPRPPGRGGPGPLAARPRRRPGRGRRAPRRGTGPAAGSSPATPAAGCRGRPTAARWRCAPCSASRCPPRRRPATPRGLVETARRPPRRPRRQPHPRVPHARRPSPTAPDDCLRMPERRRAHRARRGHDVGERRAPARTGRRPRRGHGPARLDPRRRPVDASR